MPDELDKAQNSAKTENSERPSGDKSQETPKDTPKLVPETEVERRLQEWRVKTGRDIKAAQAERDSAKEAADRANQRLSELEDRINQSEAEKYKDSPDLLTLHQQKTTALKQIRQAEEREAAANKRMREAEEKETAVAAKELKMTIADLSTRYGVDKEELEDLKVTDPETLEKIARKISQGKTTKEAKKETKAEEESFDSGRTTGGSGELTNEVAEKMGMDEYAHKAEERYGKKRPL